MSPTNHTSSEKTGPPVKRVRTIPPFALHDPPSPPTSPRLQAASTPTTSPTLVDGDSDSSQNDHHTTQRTSQPLATTSTVASDTHTHDDQPSPWLTFVRDGSSKYLQGLQSAWNISRAGGKVNRKELYEQYEKEYLDAQDVYGGPSKDRGTRKGDRIWTDADESAEELAEIPNGYDRTPRSADGSGKASSLPGSRRGSFVGVMPFALRRSTHNTPAPVRLEPIQRSVSASVPPTSDTPCVRDEAPSSVMLGPPIGLTPSANAPIVRPPQLNGFYHGLNFEHSRLRSAPSLPKTPESRQNGSQSERSTPMTDRAGSEDAFPPAPAPKYARSDRRPQISIPIPSNVCNRDWNRSSIANSESNSLSQRGTPSILGKAGALNSLEREAFEHWQREQGRISASTMGSHFPRGAEDESLRRHEQTRIAPPLSPWDTPTRERREYFVESPGADGSQVAVDDLEGGGDDPGRNRQGTQEDVMNEKPSRPKRTNRMMSLSTPLDENGDLSKWSQLRKGIIKSGQGTRKDRIKKFLIFDVRFTALLRIFSLCCQAIALALSIQSRHLEKVTGIPGVIGSSPFLTIIYAPITITHSLVALWKEAFGRPIGLWRLQSKMIFVCLDLLFIALWFSDLSLAVSDYLSTPLKCNQANPWWTTIPTYDLPDSIVNSSTRDQLCDQQAALIAFVLLVAILYVFNMVLSLFRIFERIRVIARAYEKNRTSVV